MRRLVFLVSVAVSAETLRFGVMGDMGTGDEPQKAIARQMERWAERQGWRFVLALGDNVYDVGDPREFGTRFIDVYAAMQAKGVKIHATLGNHDVRTDGGEAQLREPAFGYIGGKDEYEFEAGGAAEGKALARFYCLNSVAWLDGDRLEERRARLRAWLAGSGRARWNILYLHHPLYSYVRKSWWRGKMGHGGSEELRKELEPMIEGRVAVVLAGHDHFYQRMRPQRGVLHIVSGAAGQLRAGVETRHDNVAKAMERRHFLAVEATAERLRIEAVDAGGVVMDLVDLGR